MDKIPHFEVAQGLHRIEYIVLYIANSEILILRSDSVISAARLNFVIFAARADFNLAEASVFHRICWRVANVVLAAKFVGDLIEGLFQFVRLVSNIYDPACRFPGSVFSFRLHLSIRQSVESTIGA